MLSNILLLFGNNYIVTQGQDCLVLVIVLISNPIANNLETELLEFESMRNGYVGIGIFSESMQKIQFNREGVQCMLS